MSEMGSGMGCGDAIFTDTVFVRVFSDAVAAVLYDWMLVAGALRVGDEIRVSTPAGVEIGRVKTWSDAADLIVVDRGLPATTSRIVNSLVVPVWMAKECGRLPALVAAGEVA